MALTKITPQMFDTSAAGHDFNIDNGTFVVDASANRVGIGTVTPSTLLHVDGTATATTFVGALTGNVTGNVSGTAATVTGAAQSAITSVGTLTALTGGTGDLIWDTTTLVVDSSANFVGMGTASPSASLDVVANNNVWTGEFTQSNTSNGDGVIVTVGSTSSSDYALSIRSDAGNTGAFNVKANGNVGIGEFSPLSLLHIKGTGDAIRVESTNTGTGGAQVDLLHFTTSPADNDVHGSINFGGYTSGTSSAYGSAIRSIWTDVSAKESKLSFYTRDDSDFAARMTIDHDGNVAMGTSTVLDGLNIYASSNTNLRLHNGTTGASTSAGGIIQQAGNEMYVWNYEPSNLIFGSNNSERIRIDSSGNVGIGTTAPIAQFAVGGNGRRIEIQGTDGVIRGFDRSASWAQIDFEAASYVFDISGSPKVSIDTSGNVGIGISSPQAKLHSYTSSTGSIPTGQFNQTADDNTALALINANNSATYSAIKLETRETQAAGWMIANEWQSAFNGDLIFRGRDGGTSSAEVLRLKSNGNVGIGTTSPQYELSFGTGYFGLNYSTGKLALYQANSTSHSTAVESIGNVEISSSITGSGSGAIKFNTYGSERMRIDSSGKVLVGKSSSNYATEGIELRPNEVLITKNGLNPLSVRGSGNGSYISINDAGTTIGSIGAFASRLYIGNSNTFLTFEGAANKIYPATSTGAGRDNAIDLGGSTARFKDLYLSGGVFLGGTGSANELEDYEEGTFTPTLGGASTAGSFTPGSGTAGRYVKVGKLCMATYSFRNCTVSGAAGALLISGNPFNAYDNSLYSTSGTIMMHEFEFNTDRVQSLYMVNNKLYGLESINGSPWADWPVTNSTSLYLHVTICFEVDE